MSSNQSINSPFLRTSRKFPEEPQELSVELYKAYIDTAQTVNNRTVSIFAMNNQIVNGESWYLNAGKQQGSRQVYGFTSAGNIPHGLDFAGIAAFTKIYGTYTDGTNWYPLPYVGILNATNQVSVIVNPTNIVIGAGGTSPPIVSGLVILEWINKA